MQLPVLEGAPGSTTTVEQWEPALRSCEARLIARIRNDWALRFGSREVQLVIEYGDGLPVLIRVMENRIAEEKLK